MEYGYLVFLPPIITTIVALITKKVAPGLLLGILAGELLLRDWNLVHALICGAEKLVEICLEGDNWKTFLFTSLMGAFVILVRVSGGVDGFVHWLTEQSSKVRGPKSAMLIAYLIGLIIFIDSQLSIMFTGVVSRPLIDKYKVSREKLAYICGSTSAPVNALFPLNSWGAMLTGLIGAEVAAGVISGDPMTLLLESLPFQFYSIICLLAVLFYVLTGRDWGPMKKAEVRVRTTGKLYDDGVTPLMDEQGDEETLVPPERSRKINMLLPLAGLIGCTFTGLFITGGGNITRGDGRTSILTAVTITLILMAAMYRGQRIMSLQQFLGYVWKGVKSMVSLVVLLILAFAIGGVIKELDTGPFLASLLGDSIDGAFGPAIIFLLGALMAFATGTSWGTFSIMMPIAIPMAAAMDANILLTIGAVISGGIFGDHCSPISDTTILSSMSVGTDLFSHMKTQMPYALVSAGLTAVLFVVFGVIL